MWGLNTLCYERSPGFWCLFALLSPIVWSACHTLGVYFVLLGHETNVDVLYFWIGDVVFASSSW